jgi:hypothetical protein
MQPRYLGDGVYAEYDGFQVWLKVEGFNADNRIAIEPTVFDALCRYYAEIGVVRGVVADQAQVIALKERIAKLENALKVSRKVLNNFTVKLPDADGFVWLHLLGKEITGAGAVNLGASNRVVCMVATLLEEDRSRALREVDSVMSETNIDGRV